MRRKLYFAHPINTYNSDLEEYLVEIVQEYFAAWEIENPNQQKHQDGYKKFREEKGNGMRYFTEEVLPECRGIIALPFRDGKWGAGVAKEVLYFLENKLSAWQISLKGQLVVVVDLLPEDLGEDMILSVEETRARLRDADGNSVPY